MKNLIKILMLAVIVVLISSCGDAIDGDVFGEKEVIYYGNIVDAELTLDDSGYVNISCDVDNDGKTEFDVILANSFIEKINVINNKPIRLRVVSSYVGILHSEHWYVIEVITQPDIKDYLDFEKKSDTTKIILK